MAKQGFLDHVIPVPEDLKNPDTGTYGGPDAEKLDQLRESNREKYGYTGWYDFCNARWGTKWDVDCENIELSDDGHTVEAGFESAWSPPIGVYERLVEDGFQVTAFYNEMGCCFAGKWANGVDEYYEFNDANSQTIRSIVGYEIDNHFGLSQTMAEWEAEESVEVEELTEWYKDGVKQRESVDKAND